MKGKISITTVKALARGDLDASFISDDEIIGFIGRRLPSGKVSFGFQYTDANGKRRWIALGLLGAVTVDEVRKQAKIKAGLVAQGRDPVAERKAVAARSTNSVNHVIDQWLEKYARDPETGNLRSADEIEAMMDRYVRPEIGDKTIYDVTLSDITNLLDSVRATVKRQTGGKKTGGTMANRVRAHLRSIWVWQQDRDEVLKALPLPFPSKKRGAKEKRRERALDQEEFRDFWRALDNLEGIQPAFWRSLFLSACRRNEIARMHIGEIDPKWVDWTIPASRYKTKVDHVIPLTPALKAVLPPRPNAGDYLFSTTGGKRPMSGFSKFKPKLMRAINELRKAEGRGPIANFTPHDLRRTAKTYMSASGVLPHVSDRVLGHLQPGMRAVYDRYQYRDEKAAAIETLAAHIHRIVTPPPPNLLAFPSGDAAATGAPKRRGRVRAARVHG